MLSNLREPPARKAITCLYVIGKIGRQLTAGRAVSVFNFCAVEAQGRRHKHLREAVAFGRQTC